MGLTTDAKDIVLNKIRWLDNIGRSTRSSKNEKLENFLTDLQRLTIVHESDGNGGSHYRFAEGVKAREGGDDGDGANSAKAKDNKDKQGKSDSKAGSQKDGKGVAGNEQSKDTGKGKTKSASFDRKQDDAEQQSNSNAAEGDKHLMDQHGQGIEAEEARWRGGDTSNNGPGDRSRAEVSTRDQHPRSRSTYPYELGAVSTGPQRTVKGTTDAAKDAGAETEQDGETSSGTRAGDE